MTGRPIVIEWAAQVREWLRGTDQVERSLDDIATDLKDAGRDAEQFERDFTDAMRDAERDVETLERAIKDLPDATDDAARKMGADFDRMGDDAREAGREIGGEFKQSLGESLASGGSLGEVITETMGEAISGLTGPVGAAAGLIAGGALLVFNQVKKDWEKVQAEIAATTETFWTSALDNLKGQIGKASIIFDQALAVQQEVDRLWRESPDDMKKLVDQAKILGINANDVVLARAGDEAAIQRVNDALRESERRTDNYLGMTHDAITAHDDITTAIHEGGAALDINKAKIDAYNDSLPAVAEAHRIIKEHAEDTAWATQKTAEDAAKIRDAFKQTPNDLTIRLHADASELRQYFPYGVGGGQSAAYQASGRAG